MRQAEAISVVDSVADDVNWLRFIAEVLDQLIAEEMQNRPLAMPPDWLMPGEHLVLCLNSFLKGFRKKGYLCLTNHRIVLMSLSGDYVDGTHYYDKALELIAGPGYWRVKFNTNITSQKMACPYPIPSILTFFTNRRLCK